MKETYPPYWLVSVIEHQYCCVPVTQDNILAPVYHIRSEGPK